MYRTKSVCFCRFFFFFFSLLLLFSLCCVVRLFVAVLFVLWNSSYQNKKYLSCLVNFEIVFLLLLLLLLFFKDKNIYPFNAFLDLFDFYMFLLFDSWRFSFEINRNSPNRYTDPILTFFTIDRMNWMTFRKVWQNNAMLKQYNTPNSIRWNMMDLLQLLIDKCHTSAC